MGSKNKRRNQASNGTGDILNGNKDLEGQKPLNPSPSEIEPTDLTHSHLKLFSEAKDSINNLFDKIDHGVQRARDFYSENEIDPEINRQVVVDKLKHLTDTVHAIKGVVSRNQMKVAFFGRTSNGKSTTINAILHDTVLPSGFGDTTGCFLQIQGNLSDEAYFEIMRNDEKIERKPLQSIEHDVNALNSGALERSSLVKIYWPVSKCPLLKYDVVLVDSPGVDVEDNLDTWIDKHCNDADVFVLVSNSESTLNNSEKKFFHRVSQKLSNPIIFILNNRWDSIADDPKSMDRVRGQHVKRAIEFLSEELKINTKEEAEERIFFVSARETLNLRKPGSQNLLSQRPGSESRYQEFVDFERRFEESLSKSAVQTKFKKHTDRGLITIDELNNILKDTQNSVQKLLEAKQEALRHNEEHHANLKKLFYDELEKIESLFKDLKCQILITTDHEFDSEISNLWRIINRFPMKFHPNQPELVYYKEQLYRHVEENLSENLQTRINTVIRKNVDPIKKLLCDMSQLLSEDRQKSMKELIMSETFIQDDLLDLCIYRQFYTEFQEDLEFRFSLGIFKIIREIQTKIFRTKSPHSYGSMDKTNESQSHYFQADTDFVNIIERFLIASPHSPTTVGSIAVIGIVARTVGWRAIIIGSSAYGLLYLLEYMRWNNSAKEQTFKKQYSKYARKGLTTVSESITKHIANSVEQKVSSVFSKFKQEIDMEKNQVQSKLSFLRSAIVKLHACEQFSSQLCGYNDVLKSELLSFATSFLQ